MNVMFAGLREPSSKAEVLRCEMTAYLSTPRIDNWVKNAKLRQASQIPIQCKRSSSYPELHKDLSSFARLQYRAKPRRGRQHLDYFARYNTIVLRTMGTNIACATG